LISFARTQSIFKECLIGLSPIALCRIQFNLNNSNSNVKSDIHFDAIKNLSLAARFALNLYECAISASNAD
jgi:hypothetical protein